MLGKPNSLCICNGILMFVQQDEKEFSEEKDYWKCIRCGRHYCTLPA